LHKCIKKEDAKEAARGINKEKNSKQSNKARKTGNIFLELFLNGQSGCKI
jgi:hypothetical protein